MIMIMIMTILYSADINIAIFISAYIVKKLHKTYKLVRQSQIVQNATDSSEPLPG